MSLTEYEQQLLKRYSIMYLQYAMRMDAQGIEPQPMVEVFDASLRNLEELEQYENCQTMLNLINAIK